MFRQPETSDNSQIQDLGHYDPIISDKHLLPLSLPLGNTLGAAILR
jgi:hypothetical protein